ncbi:MAG TPA: hypothetical protein VGR31_07290 [Planctomycetota bacterium]|jgi:Tol biopolymer transport system component|nr:hypothetical protein [Planctomycetota bacterium]
MKNRWALQVSSLVVVLSSPGWAQVTRLVSVSSSGAAGNGDSIHASISADGFSVAFDSLSSNLVGGDTNGAKDVYCRNLLNGQTEIDSVDASSTLGDNVSFLPSISADGRFVAFDSEASNLVAGDTNNTWDVFVRDRSNGTIQRVSISSGAVQANDGSYQPSISADGRYVAFTSSATNLVPGDTNGVLDIFIRDRLSGVTERVSVSSAGLQGDGESSVPSISADGRFVAFQSLATNLVPGDTNGVSDIFVRDRLNGVTVRASVNNMGSQGNGDSSLPSISADGRIVAFQSLANNLIGPLAFDTNGVADVFCRNLVDGTTGRVSVSSSSVAEGNNLSGHPSISADGRFVAFHSYASNLVPGDTNGHEDVFVHDRSTDTTERVSLASNGTQGDENSSSPSISADGRFVAFESSATSLVPGDTNGVDDVFLYDRNASGFTSLCFPGVDGVHACPCSNPPSVPGRGCNNSSATGGAFLTASGIAYLSMDSLVFTTFAEKPTALSTVWQGPTSPAAGIVYGQGVRCVNGSLHRLYNKTAVTGSITAPDFGSGDPTVSARSAAQGDVIQPGQSRFYFVSYRDPTVLGGCPASSTFNATQTGEVTWMP